MSAKFGYWQDGDTWKVAPFSGGEPVGEAQSFKTYDAAVNACNDLNVKHEIAQQKGEE